MVQHSRQLIAGKELSSRGKKMSQTNKAPLRSPTSGQFLPVLPGHFGDRAITKHLAHHNSCMKVKIKRVYAPPDKNDGTRILVDRLWPRGLTKEKAQVDLWFKEVAPSTELRKWFSHDPEKWTEFQVRYKAELKNHHEQLELLKKEGAKGTVTLLYGTKDEQHNEAVVLQQLLSR